MHSNKVRHVGRGTHHDDGCHCIFENATLGQASRQGAFHGSIKLCIILHGHLDIIVLNRCWQSGIGLLSPCSSVPHPPRQPYGLFS